jgi:hypothetical protein
VADLSPSQARDVNAILAKLQEALRYAAIFAAEAETWAMLGDYPGMHGDGMPHQIDMLCNRIGYLTRTLYGARGPDPMSPLQHDRDDAATIAIPWAGPKKASDAQLPLAACVQCLASVATSVTAMATLQRSMDDRERLLLSILLQQLIGFSARVGSLTHLKAL